VELKKSASSCASDRPLGLDVALAVDVDRTDPCCGTVFTKRSVLFVLRPIDSSLSRDVGGSWGGGEPSTTAGTTLFPFPPDDLLFFSFGSDANISASDSFFAFGPSNNSSSSSFSCSLIVAALRATSLWPDEDRLCICFLDGSMPKPIGNGGTMVPVSWISGDWVGRTARTYFD